VMPKVAYASILLVVFITTGTTISVMAGPVCTVVVPNELRALCLTLLGSLSAPICLGLAPLAVSALSGAIGGPAMIGRALAIVCGTTSILGAAMFAFGRRYFSNVATQ